MIALPALVVEANDPLTIYHIDQPILVGVP